MGSLGGGYGSSMYGGGGYGSSMYGGGYGGGMMGGYLINYKNFRMGGRFGMMGGMGMDPNNP